MVPQKEKTESQMVIAKARMSAMMLKQTELKSWVVR